MEKENGMMIGIFIQEYILKKIYSIIDDNYNIKDTYFIYCIIFNYKQKRSI